MVVRLSESTVRDAVDDGTYGEAERLLASGALSDIIEVGGGASALVQTAPTGRGTVHDAWVGVDGGTLVSECSCEDLGQDAFEDLCVHAVAVVLAALRSGFDWASAAIPPSEAGVDLQLERLCAVASRLPHERLAQLLAESALLDPRIEARLLAEAGADGACDVRDPDEEADEDLWPEPPRR